MTRATLPRWIVGYGLATVAVIALVSHVSPPRQVLRGVYTPGFATLPHPAPPGDTLAFLIAELRKPHGQQFLARLAPSESGALWLALAVALVVGFDLERRRSPRDLDLLLLLPGVFLYHALGFFATTHEPAYVRLLDWVFSGVVLASLTVLGRALVRAMKPLDEPWQPWLPLRTLMALALLLTSLNVLIALVRPPDDAGYFINLGAQRFRERGLLPYGDPLLDGSAGAAYGPLMYVAHVPFQWLFDGGVRNASSPDLPGTGSTLVYWLPSELATRVCTITFHLIGLVALWVAARRLADQRVAWGVVSLYAGSLAVLGVGGEVDQVTGLSFVSHIAPASAVLGAFAFLPRPTAAGGMLAIAAGLGFYPGFMVPAWVGYYWTDRRRLWRFVAGVTVTALAILLLVVGCSRASPGRTLPGTFLWDTFGHHTDPASYGRSPFGFWGQRGPVRSWFMHPLLGGSRVTTPALLMLVGLALVSFFVIRGRQAGALALASGAVAIGAALVKVHSTGTYLAWWYPLLLLGHFAWRPLETEVDPGGSSPAWPVATVRPGSRVANDRHVP